MTTKTKTGSKPKTPVDEANEAAGEALEAMVSAGRDTFETMMKTGMDAYVEGYEKAVALGAGQVGNQNATYERATAMGKENIETATAVATAMRAGFEAMSHMFVENLKETTAFNVDYFTRLASAKSPQDFAAIQMEAATKTVDRAVADTVAFNKIAAETFTNTVTPVKMRLDKMVESVMRPAA